MDQVTKSMILSRIYSIEVNDLLKYIRSGDITLEEMKMSGNLGSAKRIEMETVLDTEETERRAREDQERNARELQRAKEHHLQQINNRNLSYDEDVIKQLLIDRLLTTEDLVQGTHLTHADIDRMLNEYDLVTGFDEWRELPALREGRTDVYVFGVVGSGKSCLLAGILYYGNKNGRIGVDTENVIGVKYKDELIKRIDLGILPKSTREDVLNFIAVPFHDEKDRPHPLSIIEMSGEKFTRSYEKASVRDESSIGARNYLHNSNRKIIMFVIDYSSHRTGMDRQMMATQSAQLEMTLGLLSKDGTLDKTDAVFVVVTKCDLLPNQQNVGDAAVEFLQNEYMGFVKNCRRMKEKHQFELVIHPFSLGHFVLPKTYNYSPAYSSNIFDDLVYFSFLEKKKSRWKIF